MQCAYVEHFLAWLLCGGAQYRHWAYVFLESLLQAALVDRCARRKYAMQLLAHKLRTRHSQATRPEGGDGPEVHDPAANEDSAVTQDDVDTDESKRATAPETAAHGASTSPRDDSTGTVSTTTPLGDGPPTLHAPNPPPPGHRSSRHPTAPTTPVAAKSSRL